MYIAFNKEVQNLTDQINGLRFPTSSPRARLCRRSFPRLRNTSTSREQTSICWYHNRFGIHAHKCISPCAFILVIQCQENSLTRG
uniref:Uncharacterized protein n=1 Tax=Octopus bimaculoides TaxID=37653 RepID=A0A0L8H3U6_OCTBM